MKQVRLFITTRTLWKICFCSSPVELGFAPAHASAPANIKGGSPSSPLCDMNMTCEGLIYQAERALHLNVKLFNRYTSVAWYWSNADILVA